MQQLIDDAVTLLKSALGVSVYPTPHVGWLPPSIRLPAVGVHDAAEARGELPGESMETSLTLELACFVQATDPERAHAELLALASQARSTLVGRPDIDRVEWAASPKGSGTELFAPDHGPVILRKVLTITFDMEVA